MFFGTVTADGSSAKVGGFVGDTKLGRGIGDAAAVKLDEDEKSKDEGHTVPKPGSHKVSEATSLVVVGL